MEKVSLGLSLLSILMSIRIGFVPAIGYEVNPIWLFIIIASGLVSIILGIINLNKNVNKKMSIAGIVISLLSIVLISLLMS